MEAPSSSRPVPPPFRPMTSTWSLRPLRRTLSTMSSSSESTAFMDGRGAGAAAAPLGAALSYPGGTGGRGSVASLTAPAESEEDIVQWATRMDTRTPQAAAVSAWQIPSPTPTQPLPAALSETAAALADLLHPATNGLQAVRIVLAGPPGAGKATVAHTVASAVAERFDVGWILDGATEPAILLGLQELAAELLQGATGQPETLVDTVHRELSRADRGGWLLIVENAAVDVVDEIVASLLPDRNGCVVMTRPTRDVTASATSSPTTVASTTSPVHTDRGASPADSPEGPATAKTWITLTVPPLSADDVRELLTAPGSAPADTGAAAPARDNGVDAIAQLLAQGGGAGATLLTVAVAQRYVARAGMTWPAFEAAVRNRAAATGDVDAAVLALAVDAVADAGPDARAVLGLLQVLHPTRIPRALLGPRAEAAVAAMHAAGLLVSVTDTHVSVHPLVQQALRAVLPAEAAAATAAIQALQAAMSELGPASNMADVRGTLVQYRHLLRWLEGPGGKADSSEAVAALRACARLHQHGFRQPAEALALYARVVEIKEAQFGTDHVNIATALIHLGSAYAEAGDHARNVELLERALAIRERRYGVEHPQVSATLVALAAAYRALGDSAKPQIQLHAALETRRPGHRREKSGTGSTGSASPSVSAAPEFSSLDPGNASPIGAGAAGDSTPPAAHAAASGEAPATNPGLLRQRELLQRALANQERQLGPEHPDVGRTMTNLGIVYYSLGEAALARDLFQRALAVKVKAFGPDHVQVAVTAFNLGLAERALDDRAAALASFQRACDIYEQREGPDHPATRQARSAIAAVAANNGNCVVS